MPLALIFSAAVIITSSKDSSIVAEEEVLHQDDMIAALQRAATAVQLSISRSRRSNKGGTLLVEAQDEVLSADLLRTASVHLQSSLDSKNTKQVKARNKLAESLDQHGPAHKSEPVMPPLVKHLSDHDDPATLLPEISQLRSQAPVQAIRRFAKEKGSKAQARIRAIHLRLQAIRKSAHKQLMVTSTSAGPMKKHNITNSQHRTASSSKKMTLPTATTDARLHRVASSLRGHTEPTLSNKSWKRLQEKHLPKTHLTSTESSKASVFSVVTKAIAAHSGQLTDEAHQDYHEPSRSASTGLKGQRTSIHGRTKSSKGQAASDVIHEAMASAMTFHAKENHWKKMLSNAAHKIPNHHL